MGRDSPSDLLHTGKTPPLRRRRHPRSRSPAAVALRPPPPPPSPPPPTPPEREGANLPERRGRAHEQWERARTRERVAVGSQAVDERPRGSASSSVGAATATTLLCSIPGRRNDALVPHGGHSTAAAPSRRHTSPRRSHHRSVRRRPRARPLTRWGGGFLLARHLPASLKCLVTSSPCHCESWVPRLPDESPRPHHRSSATTAPLPRSSPPRCPPPPAHIHRRRHGITSLPVPPPQHSPGCPPPPPPPPPVPAPPPPPPPPSPKPPTEIFPSLAHLVQQAPAHSCSTAAQDGLTVSSVRAGSASTS